MSEDDMHLAPRRRRALYRAAHRGTKEMDWVLGRYAEQAVPHMDAAMLEVFETLLALPDPDIESWVKGERTVEPEGAIGDVIMALKQFHGLA